VKWESVACGSPKLAAWRKRYADRRMQKNVTFDGHHHLKRVIQQLEIERTQALYQVAAIDGTAGFDSVRWVVDSFSQAETFFRYCKYGRVHTNATSMVRPFLRLDGRAHANVDITNSRPLSVPGRDAHTLLDRRVNLPAFARVRPTKPQTRT
jgi:hypothetical protein